jgi:hypothetical protein
MNTPASISPMRPKDQILRKVDHICFNFLNNFQFSKGGEKEGPYEKKKEEGPS